MCVCVLLLASPDLPQVELCTCDTPLSANAPAYRIRTALCTYLQFPALEDVAVCTARLSGSAADHSVQPASGKLSLEQRVDLSIYTSQRAKVCNQCELSGHHPGHRCTTHPSSSPRTCAGCGWTAFSPPHPRQPHPSSRHAWSQAEHTMGREQRSQPKRRYG